MKLTYLVVCTLWASYVSLPRIKKSFISRRGFAILFPNIIISQYKQHGAWEFMRKTVYMVKQVGKTGSDKIKRCWL